LAEAGIAHTCNPGRHRTQGDRLPCAVLGCHHPREPPLGGSGRSRSAAGLDKPRPLREQWWVNDGITHPRHGPGSGRVPPRPALGVSDATPSPRARARSSQRKDIPCRPAAPPPATVHERDSFARTGLHLTVPLTFTHEWADSVTEMARSAARGEVVTKRGPLTVEAHPNGQNCPLMNAKGGTRTPPSAIRRSMSARFRMISAILALRITQSPPASQFDSPYAAAPGRQPRPG